MDLQAIDSKLRLLSGSPIYLEGVGLIKPYTIGEIVDMGYMYYQSLLQTLVANVRDIVQGNLELPTEVEVTTFDLALNLPEDNDFRISFLEGIKIFLREEELMPMKLENGRDIILVGDIEEKRILYRENFMDLRSILLAQNGIKVSHDVESSKPQKPINKKAQEILDKLKKSQEQIDEIKRKNKSAEEVDLADIISAVTAKSPSINKFNVWDLTLYQLYEEYKRLEAINQYEVNIEAMMAGAKDIELRHWSSRLLD
jgi:hypothetical protein